MAQNVKIAGALFQAVPSISVPDQNDVYHPFTDVSDTTAGASDVATGKYFYTASGVRTEGTSSGGGGAYAWLGDGAEKVGTVFTKTINLKDDTPYDSWTASTTVTELLAASATNDYTYNADFVNYDYCFVSKGYVQPVYLSGTPMTSTTYRVCQYYISYAYGYPQNSSTSNIQTDTANAVTSWASSSNLYVQYFYNSSGVITARTATQCGPIYMSAAPSISAIWSDGTFTYKLPSFSAKCDNARFATTRKVQVDSANTNYIVNLDLYRVPHGKGLMSYWVSQMCADLNA